ncbi:wee1-like protein kinase 1-A [Oscarella lobularis]|uniref:wee1-like protein kinase 1-A n=1 Tax=Oscarella lobularis TaxID=121494 RepID=UPI00331309C7
MSATRRFRSDVSMKLVFDDEETPTLESSFEMLAKTPPTRSTPSPRTPNVLIGTPNASFAWDSSLATPTPRKSTSTTAMSSPDLDLISPPRKIERRLKALSLFEEPLPPRTPQRRGGRERGSATRLVGGSAPSGLQALRKRSMGANVNPFTPKVQSSQKKRHVRAMGPYASGGPEAMTWEEEDDDDDESRHMLRLKENNISRYNAEFQEICLIGSGEFAQVYKCRNRLDGCIYALKRSKNPIADERAVFREVCAHAVLGSHSHIVRYYSAWAEDNRMIIQNEFCNGGSLAGVIAGRQLRGKPFTEIEVKQLLFQIAQGLKHIHSMNLVHLDLKPGNVFVCCSNSEEGITPKTLYCGDSCCPDISDKHVLYKIGDMGHVTSVYLPEVEEGDCRYMANEILQEDYSHLPKADIFSLALTAFAACNGENLPKNGPDWHRIRAGWLPELQYFSPEFNNLLRAMIHPEAACRPSAEELTQHPDLSPYAVRSKDELRRELNEEKFKNQILKKELEEARGGKGRLVGRLPKGRINRSLSVNNW